MIIKQQLIGTKVKEHTQPDLELKWESFKSVFNESAKTVHIQNEEK